MDEFDVIYSLNNYDYEGDLTRKCIQLHIENRTILEFKTMEELDSFIMGIQKCADEIKKDWQWQL